MFLSLVQGDCRKPASCSIRLLSLMDYFLGDGNEAGRCQEVSLPSLALIGSSKGYLEMAETFSVKMLSDLQKHHCKIARKQSSRQAEPNPNPEVHPSLRAANRHLWQHRIKAEIAISHWRSRLTSLWPVSSRDSRHTGIACLFAVALVDTAD